MRADSANGVSRIPCPWGDWVEPAELPDPFPGLYTQIEEFIKDLVRGHPQWKPPACFSNIDYGFIASIGFNSEARKTRDGTYVIGMDAVAFPQLYDTFCRLLSNPKILPDVGLAPPGFRRQALVRYNPVGYSQPCEILHSGWDLQAPLGDDTRTACVILLISRAIQFMYLHELGHIIDGHVDYLCRHLPNSVQDLKWMEYLADRRATLLGLFFEACLGRPSESDNVIFRERFRLWGFSIAVWFHLLEEFADAHHGSKNRYPRAMTRSILVNGTVAGGPESYCDFSRDDVLEAVTNGFNEAHEAWWEMEWGEFATPELGEAEQALHEMSRWENQLSPLWKDSFVD